MGSCVPSFTVIVEGENVRLEVSVKVTGPGEGVEAEALGLGGGELGPLLWVAGVVPPADGVADLLQADATRAAIRARPSTSLAAKLFRSIALTPRRSHQSPAEVISKRRWLHSKGYGRKCLVAFSGT